jgi:hypothetical protein
MNRSCRRQIARCAHDPTPWGGFFVARVREDFGARGVRVRDVIGARVARVRDAWTARRRERS